MLYRNDTDQNNVIQRLAVNLKEGDRQAWGGRAFSLSCPDLCLTSNLVVFELVLSLVFQSDLPQVGCQVEQISEPQRWIYIRQWIVWLIQLEEANVNLIFIEHVILFENMFIVFAVETFSHFYMECIDAISWYQKDRVREPYGKKDLG